MFQRIAVLLTFVFLVSACGSERPPAPTIAVIPSDTPTDTPTITLTPSNTPTFTPTFTFTPSHTPTLTPSNTFTPSLTPSRTSTRTNTPTPTRTNTPTFTATFTPSNTPTNTSTPTLTPSNTPTITPTIVVPPTITNFTSDVTSVAPGGTIRLTWTADADRVTLETASGDGTLIDSSSLPRTGTRNVSVPDDANSSLIFRLVAERGGLVSDPNEITVTVSCPFPWFFDPSPGQCSPVPQQYGSISFQRFQSGIAFYSTVTNTVYFLNYDGRATSFTNTYVPGTVLPPASAPAGLLDAVNQIGNIWRFQSWIDGRILIGAFGYAVEVERTYPGGVQNGLNAGELYITGPEGSAYLVNLIQGTWSVVGTVVR